MTLSVYMLAPIADTKRQYSGPFKRRRRGLRKLDTELFLFLAAFQTRAHSLLFFPLE